MGTNDLTAEAIDFGQRKARETLERRAIAHTQRAAALSAHPATFNFQMQVAGTQGFARTASLQTAGFLVAAGDSWFDYPLFSDVLDLLEDEHGYNVESSAQYGDRIEAMAYRDGQLDKFARCLEKVLAHGVNPKAVLLSGGGDDIAGKEFGMLLNNAASAIGGWNAEIVDGVLNQRILTAFKCMLAKINELCKGKMGKSLPILVHGYDYPVPDGRGYLGFVRGPWLKPGFQEKLFDDLGTNVALIHDVIDQFNKMLAGLVQDPAFPYVRYIDLRNTLSADLTNDAYRNWWDNELHPSKKGFSAVAAKFADELSKLP